MSEPVEDNSRIVKATGTPAPVPPEHEEKQRRAFFRMLAAIWKIGSHIKRLEEAGLRVVETIADKRAAEARVKVAEAAEQFAKADAAKQDSALKTIEAATKVANNLDASGDKRTAHDLRKMAAQVAKLQLAISAIQQAGGQVVFDQQQIAMLLRQGLQEFPDDPVLRQVEPKLLEPSPPDAPESEDTE